MKVKAIMIPFEELKCISVHQTIKEALDTIDQNSLLSMPVVDERKFIGVLSKQYVYETFFKEYAGTKEEFLSLKVQEMMKTRLEALSMDTCIEDAAALFIQSKYRFIPVINEREELAGIVTQRAIFKEYQQLFGEHYDTLTIYSYDYRGMLAKIAETIAKNNGNIKNIVIINTDTMCLQEIFIRVQSQNFDAIVKALEKKGFDVRVSKCLQNR
ncbi:MAG: CBS domain-containing protein [Lachnospiraceae bacterium]|nr:CBS domain-containing protein [Lachnospiraceae bacterium]